MLILASASPRRQELLRAAGIAFIAQPADIDERLLPGESPQAYSERLAREKALAVFQMRTQDYVLGADTIVVVDNQILGKPRDEDDAARMLRLLAGRTHTVITGVCVASSFLATPDNVKADSKQHIVSANIQTASESTLVTMTEISEDEIRDYIATGEPMDKAGAYAIQGIASRWIPRIEGDYSNVVGLPIAMVYSMLKKNGGMTVG
jgi:septum formation protein